MMNSPEQGRIAGIAVRTKRNGPMRQLDTATAIAGAGLEGDLPVDADRGVTLLAKEQWDQVSGELGVSLPWVTRRANLLVEGLDMSSLLGRQLTIGDVTLIVCGETKPCDLMDRQHLGLRQVLAPEFRGGVHGRVVRGGTVAVGDAVVVGAAS